MCVLDLFGRQTVPIDGDTSNAPFLPVRHRSCRWRHLTLVIPHEILLVAMITLHVDFACLVHVLLSLTIILSYPEVPWTVDMHRWERMHTATPNCKSTRLEHSMKWRNDLLYWQCKCRLLTLTKTTVLFPKICCTMKCLKYWTKISHLKINRHWHDNLRI